MKTKSKSIVPLMMLVMNFTIYLFVAYLQKKDVKVTDMQIYLPGPLSKIRRHCLFHNLFNNIMMMVTFHRPLLCQNLCILSI